MAASASVRGRDPAGDLEELGDERPPRRKAALAAVASGWSTVRQDGQVRTRVRPETSFSELGGESDAEAPVRAGRATRSAAAACNASMPGLAESGGESSGDEETIARPASGGRAVKTVKDIGTDADPEVAEWEQDFHDRRLGTDRTAYSRLVIDAGTLRKLLPESMLGGKAIFDAERRVNLDLLLGAYHQLRRMPELRDEEHARHIGWLTRKACNLGLVEERELRLGKLNRRGEDGGQEARRREEPRLLMMAEQSLRIPSRRPGQANAVDSFLNGGEEQANDEEAELQKFVNRRQKFLDMKAKNAARKTHITATCSKSLDMKQVQAQLTAPRLTFDMPGQAASSDEEAAEDGLEITVPGFSHGHFKAEVERSRRMEFAKRLSFETIAESSPAASTQNLDVASEPIPAVVPAGSSEPAAEVGASTAPEAVGASASIAAAVLAEVAASMPAAAGPSASADASGRQQEVSDETQPVAEGGLAEELVEKPPVVAEVPPLDVRIGGDSVCEEEEVCVPRAKRRRKLAAVLSDEDAIRQPPAQALLSEAPGQAEAVAVDVAPAAAATTEAADVAESAGAALPAVDRQPTQEEVQADIPAEGAADHTPTCTPTPPHTFTPSPVRAPKQSVLSQLLASSPKKVCEPEVSQVAVVHVEEPPQEVEQPPPAADPLAVAISPPPRARLRRHTSRDSAELDDDGGGALREEVEVLEEQEPEEWIELEEESEEEAAISESGGSDAELAAQYKRAKAERRAQAALRQQRRELMRERLEEARRQQRQLRFEVADADEIGGVNSAARELHIGTSTMSAEEKQRWESIVGSPSKGSSAQKAGAAAPHAAPSATEALTKVAQKQQPVVVQPGARKLFGGQQTEQDHGHNRMMYDTGKVGAKTFLAGLRTTTPAAPPRLTRQLPLPEKGGRKKRLF